MKNEINNTVIYNATDIKKYLAGGCTLAEMHAMEKAALDDPFLAEAMEGFEGMNDTGWEKHLAAARLNVEVGQQAKIIAIAKKNNWWKVAAAAVILGGGSFLIYNNIKTSGTAGKNDPQIAKATVPVDKIKERPADTASATLVASNTTVLPTNVLPKTTFSVTPNMPVKDDKNTVANKRVQLLKDTTDGLRQNYIAATTTPQNGDIAVNKDVVYEGSKKEMTTDDHNGYQKTHISASRQKANMQTAEVVTTKPSAAVPGAVRYDHPFNAQVLGADNQPLPFANVSIKTENFGTYADVKGNFKLVSSDSLITVQVKSVGYLPRQFVLKSNGQQNKLVLSEDEVAIKDVAIIHGNVTGKATRRTRLVRDSVVNAEPADGWDNYSAYVSNNLNPLGTFSDDESHGEMEITFRVRSDYTITDIKIDNSLCANCDEEAVKKLLEQGPQWKTKKGKAGRARIKLQF